MKVMKIRQLGPSVSSKEQAGVVSLVVYFGVRYPFLLCCRCDRGDG